MRARRFRSFAKINLALEVVGKLPSGFHELKTIFATVGLHDIIEIAEARSGISVRSDHPGVPADETNLAHRAAAAMQTIARTKRGLKITIEKRIPVGGGVGGGSSNAATVLRALDTMWELNLGTTGLLETAKNLGADVPYFLVGGPALGRGRGDDIHPLDLELEDRLLLIPNQGGVSTAAVFRRFARQAHSVRARSPIDAFLNRLSKPGKKDVTTADLVNDLEPAALAESPELRSIGESLRRVAKKTGGRQVAMSGSGSTFFMLHPDAPSRKAAVLLLRSEGIETLSSSFLSKRAYERRFEIGELPFPA